MWQQYLKILLGENYVRNFKKFGKGLAMGAGLIWGIEAYRYVSDEVYLKEVEKREITKIKVKNKDKFYLKKLLDLNDEDFDENQIREMKYSLKEKYIITEIDKYEKQLREKYHPKEFDD